MYVSFSLSCQCPSFSLLSSFRVHPSLHPRLKSKAEKLRINLAKLREAKQRGVKVRLHVTRKGAAVNPLSGNSDEPTVVALSRINDKGAEMPVHIPNLIVGDYRYIAFVILSFLYVYL